MSGNCITCCITQSCWWNLNIDHSFPSRRVSWLMHWEREASGILDGPPITCPTECEKPVRLCFRNCAGATPASPSLFPSQDGAELRFVALLRTISMSGFVYVQWLLPAASLVLPVPQPGPGLCPRPLALCGGGGGTATTPKSTTREHPWTLLQGVPGRYLTLPKTLQGFPEEL